MISLIQITTKILSLFTIVGDVVIILIIVILLTPILRKKYFKLISKNSVLFAFIISLGATLGSLFYSGIVGFEPCVFCWFQRIFMYPLVIFLGIALLKKEKNISDYILPFSISGIILSGFHYYSQITGSSLISCSINNYAVSCSQRYIFEFGYITMPVMGLTIFILITLLMITNKVNKKY